MSGTAASEGALALSADGRYLTLAGFDADPGTPTVAATTATIDEPGRGASRRGRRRRFVDRDLRRLQRGRHPGCGHRRRQPLLGRRLERRRAPVRARQRRRDHPDQQRGADERAGGGHRQRSAARLDRQLRRRACTPSGRACRPPADKSRRCSPTLPSPYGIVALDRDPDVPGIDTLYVADDSGSPGGGILKFSFDGTAWTARGSFRPSASAVRGAHRSRHPRRRHPVRDDERRRASS